MEIILSGSFSLNMVPPDLKRFDMRGQRINAPLAAKVLSEASSVRNVIGHENTDFLVRSILEAFHPRLSLPVARRETVSLSEEKTGIVAQYSGPRLEESTTKLPEGSKIVLWIITLRGEER
jgi:hypothetical protein